MSLEGYGGGKQQTYAPSLLPLLTHYASFFAATRNPTAPPSQPPSHRPGHPTGSGAASRGHACNDQDTSSAHPPPPPPRRTDLLSHVRVSALGGEGREYSARAQPVTPLLHVSRHLEQVIRPETRATRDHGPNAKLSRLRTRPPKNAAGCLAPPHLRKHLLHQLSAAHLPCTCPIPTIRRLPATARGLRHKVFREVPLYPPFYSPAVRRYNRPCGNLEEHGGYWNSPLFRPATSPTPITSASASPTFSSSSICSLSSLPNSLGPSSLCRADMEATFAGGGRRNFVSGSLSRERRFDRLDRRDRDLRIPAYSSAFSCPTLALSLPLHDRG